MKGGKKRQVKTNKPASKPTTSHLSCKISCKRLSNFLLLVLNDESDPFKVKCDNTLHTKKKTTPVCRIYFTFKRWAVRLPPNMPFAVNIGESCLLSHPEIIGCEVCEKICVTSTKNAT